MALFAKWLAAGLLSTSLIFTVHSAEARPKHAKTQKTHVKHKKTVKKSAKKHGQTHAKKQKKSDGYAKASGYMKRSPASTSSHVKTKKKSKKMRRT